MEDRPPTGGRADREGEEPVSWVEDAVEADIRDLDRHLEELGLIAGLLRSTGYEAEGLYHTQNPKPLDSLRWGF